ncbi:hypothetical protein LZ31DRAFT_349725 [Colletotrichum somersetense]|nr:hypothetical protein LZ31DRAFT_349725 [Colletotrichum somersetense]
MSLPAMLMAPVFPSPSQSHPLPPTLPSWESCFELTRPNEVKRANSAFMGCLVTPGLDAHSSRSRLKWHKYGTLLASILQIYGTSSNA